MREASLIVALLIGGAADIAAQTRETERRVDSLARMAAAARGAVQAYDDSVGQVARAIDTVFAGPPLVVAERDISAQARAIAPAVIGAVQSAAGRAMSRLSGHTLRLHLEKRADWGRAGDTTRELIVSILRPGGARMRAWHGRSDSANMAATLRFAATYAAYAVAGPSLLAWASNAIPTDTLRASDWANQRLHLISSQTAVARRCYAGDSQACRVALMLAPGADPILEWHDSTTRQSLVRRFGSYARRMDQRAVQQCLAGSDASCIAVLQLFPRETFREPTAAAVRSGFLRYALAVGGEGAVERLLSVDGAGQPMARLEAASRLPVDSLIGSWRGRIHSTRAPSEDLTVGITILSLAWATGMGALSLRSSRWR